MKCPKCQADTYERKSYCRNCGTRLSISAVGPANQSAPHARRRQGIVLLLLAAVLAAGGFWIAKSRKGPHPGRGVSSSQTASLTISPNGREKAVETPKHPAAAPEKKAAEAPKHPAALPPKKAVAADHGRGRPAPKPATPAVVPATAYTGKSSGVLLWSGQLEKDTVVTIDGASASTGTMYYSLPGVPVSVHIETPGVVLVQEPNQKTGWKHLVFRSNIHKHMVVSINWERIQ